MTAATHAPQRHFDTIDKEPETVIRPSVSCHRLSRVTLAAFAAALLLLAGHASGAAAAPQLEVQVSHAPTTMPRTDERLTYQVLASNVATDASPLAGEQLSCVSGTWTGAPTLGYRWLRDGVALGPANGGETATYTVQPADEGHSLQCLVTATNAGAAAAAISAPLLAGQAPPTPPPAPTNPKIASSRPTITGTGVAKRTCTAPAGWGGSPTWSFQWLRNGVPIPGATANEYVPAGASGGDDEKKVLQCMVVGTNPGGAAAGVSNGSNVGTISPAPPSNAVANTPIVTTDAYTSGQLELELRLPLAGGALIVSAAGSGWTCTKLPGGAGQAARASCVSSEVLAPGASASPVTIVAAIGADVPDGFVTEVSFENAGEAATTSDSFDFTAPAEFGVVPGSFETKVLDAAGEELTRAGAHPFSASTKFAFNSRVVATGELVPVDHVRDIRAELPPGFLGNPRSVPQRCASIEDVLDNRTTNNLCPSGSVVGGVTVALIGEAGGLGNYESVVYAIEPERGAPAQFAFQIGAVWLYSLSASLRPDAGYAITVEAPLVAKMPQLREVSFTFCGFGAKVGGLLFPEFEGCRAPGEAGANPKPLLTNPSRCSGTPPVTTLAVDSWEDPGKFKRYEAQSPEVTGCQEVPFDPEVSLRPTSVSADSPTGLLAEISMPTEGLETPAGTSQGNLKHAVVRLPAGMAVNPAAADGLGACDSAQVGLGTNEPVRCPDSSRIGSAEVRTPLLDDVLEGSVYLARQGDNPFGSLLALYLVVESEERGVVVKIPGKVNADPRSGQLVADFDENPQLPFSALRLRFNEGDRAPLLNPPRCGSYAIEAQLSPWSAADPTNPTAGETRSQVSSFAITTGPGGGPCPDGGLRADLGAGLANPIAASTSPFTLNLSRPDGTQRFRSLDLGLPPGLTAYLKDVPHCPEAALAAVSGALGSGAAELASPSCPAASRIGSVSVAVGGGRSPFHVDTGSAYLAGPYKGAPLSIAVIAPAVAGPFDLGSVVVRSAVDVDPTTARIGVRSDPIPTILHGIPLDLRDVRISVDRPQFTLAPSNCDPMAVEAGVGGERGGAAALRARFQVTDCGSLAAKPKIKLNLRGATKRSGNPALTAVVTYPKQGRYANIKRVAVALPHSEFLDQSHIGTVCTRAEFAAERCPAASIYGEAEAWSPLLGYPLSGPVYLRGNGGERQLPDLVVALRGPAWQPIRIDLVGWIDSARGGIRNTFATVPDAPVSRFVLRMRGGKRGLLENSTNLCRAPASARTATARVVTHDNQRADQFPVLSRECRKRRGARPGLASGSSVTLVPFRPRE